MVSDMDVKPLISENKMVASCSWPPKLSISSFSKSWSTICLETYFLKVDFNLSMLDKSSIATTEPMGSFESFISGETEILTVVNLPLHSINTWLSESVTDSNSHLVISCVTDSLDSKIYS